MAAGVKSPFDVAGVSTGVPPIPAATAGFVGLLDLSGVPVGTITGSVFQPQTAAVTATGYAPTWATNVRFFPLTGEVLVTGYAGSWSTPEHFSPDTGATFVTGYAPQWLVNTPVQFGTGAVAVTGYAPAWARMVECASWDATFVTMDQDSLTMDLVAHCDLVPQAFGGGEGKKAKLLRPWTARGRQRFPIEIPEPPPLPPPPPEPVIVKDLVGAPMVPSIAPRATPLPRAEDVPELTESLVGALAEQVLARGIPETPTAEEAWQRILESERLAAERDDEEALMALLL